MCLIVLLNIILTLSTTKKANEVTFCPRFKIYVLLVSTIAFVSKIIRPIIIFIFCSQESKFSTAKEFLHSQGNVPWSRKFSTIKKFLHKQENFAQPQTFFLIKEFFCSQGFFPQSRKFSTNMFNLVKKISKKPGSFLRSRKFSIKYFTWSRKFSSNKEVLHKICFSLIKEVFHNQRFSHKQKKFLRTRIKKVLLKLKF